jgi:hypothetical protein
VRRQGIHTALGSGLLPYADTDRPDEDDPEVQRIALSLGIDPMFLANTAEETAITIFRRTGERPPLEDVLAALEVAAVEMMANARR